MGFDFARGDLAEKTIGLRHQHSLLPRIAAGNGRRVGPPVRHFTPIALA
jgi:hypothetical protein